MRIEIHLIVPDHLGGVLAKTSENACVGDLATKFVSATGTALGIDRGSPDNTDSYDLL